MHLVTHGITLWPVPVAHRTANDDGSRHQIRISEIATFQDRHPQTREIARGRNAEARVERITSRLPGAIIQLELHIRVRIHLRKDANGARRRDARKAPQPIEHFTIERLAMHWACVARVWQRCPERQNIVWVVSDPGAL